MNFGQAIKTVFSKLFSIQGRASRPEYWWYQLFILILSTVVNWFFITPLTNVATATTDSMTAALAATIPVSLLFGAVFFLLNFSVTVRRLHDTNRSGYYYFMYLIPFAGPIILFVYMLLASTPGANNFGPNPQEK